MGQFFNTITRDTQIQLHNPFPGTTPYQVLAVGPYGVVDMTNATNTTLANIAAPAFLLPTTDPHVTNALFITNNTVTISVG